MGNFVKQQNNGTKKYVAVVKNPFVGIFQLEQILKFYKFTYFGKIKSSETFYDTPNDLLEKAGVILSRVQDNGEVYFKVEQSAYMQKAIKNLSSKIFIHKVGPRDSLSSHAFYLVDGIKELFSTPFSIDLENVVKNAVPKIRVSVDAQVYKVISGTGFRADVILEDKEYKNFETKRENKSQGMTVKQDGPEQYLKEFNSFNDAIQKYCKQLIETNDTVYEHAKRLTQKIEVVDNKKDIKKKKEE